MKNFKLINFGKTLKTKRATQNTAKVIVLT